MQQETFTTGGIQPTRTDIQSMTQIPQYTMSPGMSGSVSQSLDALPVTSLQVQSSGNVSPGVIETAPVPAGGGFFLVSITLLVATMSIMALWLYGRGHDIES